MQFDVRKYGFVPFWFWNGEQDGLEVRRQVRLAARSGLGGLAIHAREGNKTPYLSGKWFRLVEAACEEAEKHGLQIWIYDEEGYPSGTAGCKIQKISPLFRQQYLSFGYFSFDELGEKSDVVAVFESNSYCRVEEGNPISSKEKYLVFQRKFVDSYVDTMNPEVAGHFIRLTHEKYKGRLGKYFGTTITYFYTDDVNFHMEGYKGLPWTDRLDCEFQRRHSYSLLENLPALVENLPNSKEVRKDYYGTLLDLFIANFAEPIYRWCNMNGVKFTGHLRGDEGPLSRAIIQFSSAMPFFEYEDVPGIDDFLLRLHDCRYLKTIRNQMGLYPIPTYKFASSMANQLKDGTCGAEVMASCGWGYSLAEQNAQLSFEANMGINLFTPHDFSYATAGVAKRDHPPSFFIQQPYWRLWKHLHAKFARISRLLHRGTHHANVLVFYPESQTWVDMDGESIDPAFKCKRNKSKSIGKLAAFEKTFAKICFDLVKAHVGFDVGSERLMEKHAQVKSGRLHMGKMSYGTVIMPVGSECSFKNRKILDDFTASGGVIIFSDSRKNNYLMKDIELRGNTADIAVHTRMVDGRKEFFISSFSPEYADLELSEIPEKYDIYDPESGMVVDIGKNKKISMPPFASAYALPKGNIIAERIAAGKSLFEKIKSRKHLEINGWILKRNSLNMMLVDSCHVDGRKVPMKEVHLLKTPPSMISIKFRLPKNKIVARILGEGLSDLEISVNGIKVSVDRSYKFPATKSLETASIRRHLVCGDNEIIIGNLEPGRRIEDFCLAGNFSVEAYVRGKFGSSAKFAEYRSPGLGNLALQGLPFYWGSISYMTWLPDMKDKKLKWLDLGKVEGAVQIFIDGKLAGTRLYPPYRIYIGDRKFRQRSRLRIRLYNTAQNFFGPHRWENLDKSIIHIEEADPGKKENFNVKPFGLYGPVRLFR